MAGRTHTLPLSAKWTEPCGGEGLLLAFVLAPSQFAAHRSLLSAQTSRRPHIALLCDLHLAGINKKSIQTGSPAGTALVRSCVQYNIITMRYHGGAAHSCSSFADKF